jgi:hypothetical protein
VVVLRWDDIDLTTGRLHVRRAKGGDASVHPISARESRALRKLLREAPTSPHVFISERRAPLSAAGYQRMVARAGVAAKFNFLVHSHMLRHACGFKLANDGHDTRHSGLSRPPLDHVHGAVHRFDAQSVQEFLERLTFYPAQRRSGERGSAKTRTGGSHLMMDESQYALASSSGATAGRRWPTSISRTRAWSIDRGRTCSPAMRRGVSP